MQNFLIAFHFLNYLYNFHISQIYTNVIIIHDFEFKNLYFFHHKFLILLVYLADHLNHQGRS
jgi:hypothetical protein